MCRLRGINTCTVYSTLANMTLVQIGQASKTSQTVAKSSMNGVGVQNTLQNPRLAADSWQLAAICKATKQRQHLSRSPLSPSWTSSWFSRSAVSSPCQPALTKQEVAVRFWLTLCRFVCSSTDTKLRSVCVETCQHRLLGCHPLPGSLPPNTSARCFPFS